MGQFCSNIALRKLSMIGPFRNLDLLENTCRFVCINDKFHLDVLHFIMRIVAYGKISPLAYSLIEHLNNEQHFTYKTLTTLIIFLKALHSKHKFQ